MEGSCPNPPTTNFTCSENETVPFFKVCDFIFDCANGRDESFCGQCDFEEGECGWTNAFIGSKYEWQRGRNGSTSGAGPTTDHTTGTGTGYYMIADKNEEEGFMYETMLVSPRIQTAFSFCEFRAWVLIENDDPNAYLQISGYVGTSPETVFWSEYNSHQEWTEIWGHVGRQHQTFIVAIKAFIGEGNNMMSIDDTQFVNCQLPEPSEDGCVGTQLTCKNGVCVDKEHICDLTDNCGDGTDEDSCHGYQNCDFEDGMCGWENLNENINWYTTNAADPDLPEVPTRDHTTNAKYGTYLGVNLGEVSENKLSIKLASPVLSSKFKYDCSLSLYMYFLPESSNILRVKTRESVGGPETEIFNKTEHEDYNYWIHKTVHFPTDINKFQVLIEQEIQESTLADIFLDDFSLSPDCETSDTELPTEPSTTPTTSDPCFFRCGDECLEPTQICNFHQDCQGNEDEQNCGA